MKKLITCMLLILSASSAYSKTLDEKPDEFLQSMAPRFPTWGTFGELVGNLKGAGLANIELKSSKAGKQKFESSPGSDTKLKYCEYFEALARYTGTNCRYAEKEKTWIFDEPEMPLPFTIKLAPGWRMENRGQYCAYIPKIAPIGMDIYMLGRFHKRSDEQLKEIRDYQALSWAKRIRNNATMSEMTQTQVDGCEALFFKSKAPVEGRQWRQWSFVKNGQTFLIVSAVSDENESKVIPDVEKMVSSFKVKDKFFRVPGFE